MGMSFDRTGFHRNESHYSPVHYQYRQRSLRGSFGEYQGKLLGTATYMYYETIT
jgi:hypothetical protein